MKKILSLFAICAMAVTSAWADDVTEVSTQEALQTVATNGGSCKLVADIDLTKTIIVGTLKTLNLDLNGHVLNGKNIPEPTADILPGCILSAVSESGIGGGSGYLYITDSDPNADHSDWNTTHPTSEGNSDLSNIKGAVLTGGKGFRPSTGVTSTCGGAIFAEDGALTVKGVTIIGNTANSGGAIYVAGYLSDNPEGAVLDGTTIINNSATYFGAINLMGSSAKTPTFGAPCLTLKDCTITGNTTGSSETYTSHAVLGTYTQPCVVGATDDGKIILKGKNNITGNTACGKTGNLCFVSLSDDDTTYPGSITLDASFDNESTIGISRIVGTATDEKYIFWTVYDFAYGSGQFTTNGTAANAAAFIPDDSNFKVAYNAAGYLETVAKPVATEVTLNETDEDYSYPFIDESTYDITINRTMKADRWNTLMLQFDMTNDEIKSNFGESAQVMKMTGIKDNVVSFESATTIETGEFYIIKPATDITKIEVKSKTATEFGGALEFDKGNNYSVLINFYQTTFDKNYYETTPMYVLSNNNFYRIDSDVTVKGYRWAILDYNGNNARALTLSLDGVIDETTGISNADVNANVNRNGKFVENGRVVIVKNNQKFNAAGQLVR